MDTRGRLHSLKTFLAEDFGLLYRVVCNHGNMIDNAYLSLILTFRNVRLLLFIITNTHATQHC